ncbi:hypothetical protein KR215_011469 [Drosophila sulfurigaster]|nr:hypothetical protein KR215_011469 [Drosophila sulfurigaster]
MRTVTLCLLVLASAISLYGVVETTPLKSDRSLTDNGFVNFLRAVLTTVRGVNCTVNEVGEILVATSKYIDDIGGCSTDVPKDIAKIIKSCNQIVTIGDDIIHLNSQLCSDEEGSSVTSTKCFVNLFSATVKLTRKIHDTLELIANLPSDTESCFVDATNEIEDSYDNFLPNINDCFNA